MDNTASPPRLWSLDVLRGSCALVVFLSHWHLWANFAPRGTLERFVRAVGENYYDGFVTATWPTGGHHPAVLCFFVLSGFCIHYPFEWRLRAGRRAPVWADYFRRRFLRIMPAYWAACLLGLVFVAAEWWHPSGNALLQLHAHSPLRHVVVRFAGLSGVYPQEIFAGNYLLNTVAVEMVMYAAYPLFYHFASRGAWSGLGAAFVGLHFVAIALLQWVTPFWVFNSVFMLGIFWYGGALAAHLYLARGWRLPLRWLVLAWGGFLLIKAIPHFHGLNLIKQAAWALVCALGIMWALDSEERHPQRGVHPVVRAFRYSGLISYSLYAVHTPAIMLANWFLPVAMGCEDYLVQLAVAMAYAVAATLFVHYAVERRYYRPRA